MVNVIRVAAVAIVSFSTLGFLNSYTSPAYTDNPSLCGTYSDACDPVIEAALESFPYWNYRASASGGGTHLLLGVVDGYMWAITCQHCGPRSLPWTLVGGDDAGQEFLSLGYTGEGAFRQFGVGDNPPLYGGHYGDLLYRLSAKPGETLPDMPFVRLLPSADMLPNDTLILTIGNGQTGTHPTLGWFTECATTQDGGMPAGGRPSCCTTERWAGNYGPKIAEASCRLPYAHQSSTFARPACWGGEGVFELCSQAGLEYLGAVWSAASNWHWGTTHLWPDNGFSLESSPSGPYLQYSHNRPAQASTPGETLAESGVCIERAIETQLLGAYVEVMPPASRTKTQMACAYTPSFPLPFFARTTGIIGDSGSMDFAYVNGVWYLIASGSGPGIGNPLWLHLPSWASWVYGSTADQDGDDVHDFSDNCVSVANGDPLVAPFNQIDSDGDGFGNACDADFDQDGIVTGSDYNIFFACYGSGSGNPACAIADLDGDGFVSGTDFGLFISQYGQAVGPSGIACADPNAEPPIYPKDAGLPCS